MNEELKEVKKEEALEKTGSRSDVNLRSNFKYLCYFAACKKGGWKVKCVFDNCLVDIPVSFLWKGNDTELLRKYIDALVGERRAESLYYENSGSAYDVVYSQTTPDKKPIKIDIKNFIEVLLLRGSIDVPCDRKIAFYTNASRKKFVPSEFITAISLLPGLEFLADKTEGWSIAAREDFEALGLTKPEHIHTGMGRVNPELSIASLKPASTLPADAVVGEAPPSSEAPPEHEIAQVRKEKHFELITSTKDEAGSPYFVRRLSTYGGHVLWAGTAFSADGPWVEYFRDSAVLIGLGIAI